MTGLHSPLPLWLWANIFVDIRFVFQIMDRTFLCHVIPQGAQFHSKRTNAEKFNPTKTAFEIVISIRCTTNRTQRFNYIVISIIQHIKIYYIFINPLHIYLLRIYVLIIKTRGGAVGWGTALQAGRSRVRFPLVSLEIFINVILPAALWSWGRLSL